MSELNKESVEQAGGDERAAFEAAFAAMGRPVCRADYDQDAYGTPFDDGGWTGWQARAALAQPSPKCATCNDSGQIVVSGPHYQGEFQPPEYETEPCDMCAQPSPAQAEQAEAERPEGPTEDELEAAGLGYPLHKEEAVKLWYSGFRSEVITVLEAWEAIGHDIGMNPDKGELLDSLRYMLEKCEAHDAAMARVAELEAHCVRLGQGGAERYWENRWRDADARLQELENQDPVAHLRASDLERLNQPGIAGSAGSLWNGPREGFVPLYAAPVAQAQHSVPKAWLDVQAERRRQVEAEGWTPEHDDLYCAAELPRAAAAYILNGANDEAPAIWPFSAKWWKPSTARRDMVKACALALAEIERLDRAAHGKEGNDD